MAAQETHTIVVVDDVPEIREILGFLLEESGWFTVVGEAGTGEAALELAEKHRPDLILLDLELPGLSGWDVLPMLRQRVPGSLVVVLSGNVEGERTDRGDLESLAAAVLEKGTSNRQLVNSLLEVVGRERFGATKVVDDPARPVSTNLADPDAWLASVVNASQDAIIGKTLDGTIVSWNPAAERLYGYRSEEIVGRSIRTIVPADRPDEVAQLLASVSRGERVESHETVRVHKDGSRIDVQLTLAPVINAAGVVVGASAIARDISTRRHTDAALARAITQLERRNRDLVRSNEELDSFAAVASHDLAQPLQVAYGFLDMLKTDYGDSLPEQAQAWLHSSLTSLERMRNLVRDILRYARTGSGEPKREHVDLAGVLADACAGVAVAIEERDAVVDLSCDAAEVVGDRGQLTLVFQNLVSNGVKFVRSDRRPHIEVRAETSGDDVVVKVSDNGVGIPPDDRTKVFEMFQRSAAGGQTFAGTGLGLAIVKKIVGRHGGAVWIEDGIDGGTTIAVRLPRPTAAGIRA
ncbi:MAG TPA: ATP-binding protein [Acidimicrobiales bacterium]|nr:ATP-binding protein [Acidimicrobiales bacterium]